MKHVSLSPFEEREPTTWPLWECIPPETLVKLIQYQWEHYGTKLEILASMPFKDFESLEEIDREMRQPAKYRRPPG